MSFCRTLDWRAAYAARKAEMRDTRALSRRCRDQVLRRHASVWRRRTHGNMRLPPCPSPPSAERHKRRGGPPLLCHEVTPRTSRWCRSRFSSRYRRFFRSRRRSGRRFVDAPVQTRRYRMAYVEQMSLLRAQEADKSSWQRALRGNAF